MGIESSNFTYWPESACKVDWNRVLIEIGAETCPVEWSKFPRYVLKSDDHWIDFQVIPAEGNTPEHISVRMALCNPDPAIEKLLSSLRLLLEASEGTLVDQHTGENVRSWSPPSESSLRTSLAEQQRQFVRYFGSRKAAIAAEEVFEVLRAATESSE